MVYRACFYEKKSDFPHGEIHSGFPLSTRFVSRVAHFSPGISSLMRDHERVSNII